MLMKRMGIGLQMYTVREDTAKDFRGTLRKIADMGYEGVEFAGYGDIPAQEMREVLDSLGLQAFGSHVGLAKLEDDLAGEIEYLKTIGAKYAVVPHLNEEQRRDWNKLFEQFKIIGEEMKKHDLIFAYHNHAFEFEEKLQGNYVFDEMFTQVNSDLLKVEMDIGWVQYAGEEPVQYIHKYSGKLPLLHLKDFRKSEPGTPIDTVELGQGDLNLTKVIQAASDADVEWLIVEQDRCANPPLQSVETSLNWIKENYLSKI
jgi:sugar phosphate isomerase/epimerase